VRPWSPPPVGSIQLNVDAALFATSRRFGAGVIARNLVGECIVALGDSAQEVVVPELAEALAVRLVLSLANDEDMINIIIASDYLSVIQRILSSNRDRSACGVVIEDIKLMAAFFTAISFHHVRRGQNIVIHRLAWSCEFVYKSLYGVVCPRSISGKQYVLTSCFGDQ
jgi:hypothetical protein